MKKTKGLKSKSSAGGSSSKVLPKKSESSATSVSGSAKKVTSARAKAARSGDASVRTVEAEIVEPIASRRSDPTAEYVERIKEQKESWRERGWQESTPQEIESDADSDSESDSERASEPDYESESEVGEGLKNDFGDGGQDFEVLAAANEETEKLEDPLKGLVLKDSTEQVEAKSRSLAVSDPVALYMAELSKYPLLTREQEQELATRYRETGDKVAAEMLVTSNLRFVVKVAAEYSKFGARLIDLIQEGNVGLMHAVREFNPYKGVRLITYAVWWIRGYIQDYLMRQYSMVRIGTTQSQRKLFYRLQKEKDLLESMGQEPNVKLLSSRLGVSESDVESMSQRMQGRDVSLQSSFDSDGKSTLLDFTTKDDVAIDDQIGQNEMLSLLQEGIEELKDSLNDRERELLEDRLLADEPLTLQEIGEKYGVTREAVRQMENRLMSKIRRILEERLESGRKA